MENNCFPKYKKILNKKDFLSLKQNTETKKYNAKHFLFVWKTNNLNFSRLGIIITKRIAKSVKRNRIRRLLREVFRLYQTKLFTEIDLLIIAKTDSSKLTFTNIREEIEQAAKCM